MINIDIDTIYKPLILNLSNKDDEEKYNQLINNPAVIVCNTIQHQLAEYVKCLNPKVKLTKEQINVKVAEILQLADNRYGNWVYYPWSNRLVNLLPQDEFTILRTNRNCYKITPNERDTLATKIIGVVGLSVGQSIALTLAMERGFGELRLADFDTLDLSNLNRIRAGVYNLGLNKAIITAREIAEIDPYLNVVCFTDGLTENNIDEFFEHNGKLDLLIDECDSLDIKILSRHKAKQLQIPVFMDTSDRGMVDIERFDLEPNRDILHGLVGDLNPSTIKGLTNEQKIPYILPMIGFENISSRLKASMMEIDETISTWPQLASSVVLGGAVGAEISRKILLNQSSVSGRFYIDLDDIIVEPNAAESTKHKNPYEPLSENNALGFITNYVKDNPISVTHPLADDVIDKLVEVACLAPSGGNCQPWKWVLNNDVLYLFHDKHYSYSLLDFEHYGSMLSLGAAVENLTVFAKSLNLDAKFTQVNNSNEDWLIGYFLFEPNTILNAAIQSLAQAVTLRHTNRLFEDKTEIHDDYLNQLKQIVTDEPEFDLTFLTNENEIKDLGEILATIERIRLLHPRGHEDFVSEIRWTEEENLATKNGVDLDTVDLSLSEKSGLRLAKDAQAIKLLRTLNKGKSFEKLMNKTMATAPVIGLLYGNKGCDFLKAGSVLERVWLNANNMQLAFHPVSPSTFMFKRLVTNAFDGFNENMVNELKDCNNKFNNIFNLQQNKEPIFVFKLFNSRNKVKKSLRKNLSEVFFKI